MNMKELASKWGWNLQADKKNIYVAKTPQMYVSLMKSQVVFFALRSIMDIRHAIDQKNILLKIQPPHGYVVESFISPVAACGHVLALSPSDEAKIRHGCGQLQPGQYIPGSSKVYGGTESAGLEII